MASALPDRTDLRRSSRLPDDPVESTLRWLIGSSMEEAWTACGAASQLRAEVHGDNELLRHVRARVAAPRGPWRGVVARRAELTLEVALRDGVVHEDTGQRRSVCTQCESLAGSLIGSRRPI